MITNPVQRAVRLRETLVSDRKLLVVNFSDTLQGQDTSKVIELMPNVATGEHIFRAKVNVKEIDILASEKYKTKFFDIAEKTDEEIEDFINKQEFDYALWWKHHTDFEMRNACDYNLPFVMQVAGCNFHDGSSTGGCWYCFVDDKSNDGLPAGKALLGVEDAVNSALDAKEKIKKFYRSECRNMDLKVIRTSGGEPTIVLDWILELWREISERGLDFVGQIDTNLSTGEVVDFFERRGTYEQNILERLAEHPVKVLAAIKGISRINLQANVQSATTMEAQKYSLTKLIKSGIDVYPTAYNPDPENLEAYLKEMDDLVSCFSLRLHIGPLKVYGPTKKRLEAEARHKGIDPAVFIERTRKEWDENYKRSCEILDGYLRGKWEVGYRDITRAEIPLKVN
ncbi:hypothetical protein KY308_03250 [Candidatus Woesearchaeota archaeon]|nr:hypothetical protein [Candidatus Woesearchaeota archaeon]